KQPVSVAYEASYLNPCLSVPQPRYVIAIAGEHVLAVWGKRQRLDPIWYRGEVGVSEAAQFLASLSVPEAGCPIVATSKNVFAVGRVGHSTHYVRVANEVLARINERGRTCHSRVPLWRILGVHGADAEQGNQFGAASLGKQSVGFG